MEASLKAPLRAVLVDDERLARENLELLLEEFCPEVHVVGKAGGVEEGLTVIGETTPLHRGRRTMVWTTRITTADGKLVAVVTQTQMVL